MNKKDDKERGILIRILTNSEIQKGIAFFSIALILAFSAIIPVVEEEIDTGMVDAINDGPELISIYYPGYRVTNATLDLNFSSIEDTDTGTSRISILDHQYRILFEENITSNENKSWELAELDLDRDPNWISFENISLEYTYTVIHESRPYGLLSLPALFFTFVGMVFAFRGKGIILGEIKRKQMEEERKKKVEEREEKTEEEKTIKEDEIEGEVIFGGDEEKEGEADHINFMGVPDEEDEEDREM